jgi:hypothetical protein
MPLDVSSSMLVLREEKMGDGSAGEGSAFFGDTSCPIPSMFLLPPAGIADRGCVLFNLSSKFSTIIIKSP